MENETRPIDVVKCVPNAKMIEEAVYPSKDLTVVALNTDDEYGGAHCYAMQNCLGFENGETKYDGSITVIQFIKKQPDGSVTPGLQNEQLIIAMKDRLAKLNAKFPHPENENQLKALQDYLDACKRRVDERIDRGVMGDLKK